MKAIKDLFRRPTLVELMRLELEDLEMLRYKEDQRRDYHAAQVESCDKRIEKLRVMLLEVGDRGR